MEDKLEELVLKIAAKTKDIAPALAELNRLGDELNFQILRRKKAERGE